MFGYGLSIEAFDFYKSDKQEFLKSNVLKGSHISIVSIDDCSKADEFLNDVGGMPIIHHLSNVAPADPYGPNLQRLEDLNKISRILDAKWCLEDVGAWSLGSLPIPYFVPTILTKKWLETLVERVNLVKEHSAVPFLLEIPNFSYVVGDMQLAEFFNILSNETDSDIVLDVSHLYSYAISKNIDELAVLNELDLSRVKEIHIAGGRVNKKYPFRYIDTHSDPIMEPCKKLLRETVLRAENLKAVTYEISVFQDVEMISRDSEIINDILN